MDLSLNRRFVLILFIQYIAHLYSISCKQSYKKTYEAQSYSNHPNCFINDT